MVDKVYYDFDKMEVFDEAMVDFLEGDFDALWGAFYWDMTPQGDEFWLELALADKRVFDADLLKELKEQYMHWFYYGGDFLRPAEEGLTNDESECTYDPVDKPTHYNMGGIECIDYIKQVLGLDGFIAYCHGNMIKYQHRYRYKQNPVEDMKKAQWYLNKMNEALEEKHQ